MSAFNFTLNATFEADTRQDAWDMWVEWLTNPLNLEDGTQVTEDDIVYSTGPNKPGTVEALGRTFPRYEGFPDCRECGKFGYHTRKAGCIIATERAAAVNGAGTEDEYDDGTPSIHLRGTEGQDRESYTDDQDRDEYTVDES